MGSVKKSKVRDFKSVIPAISSTDCTITPLTMIIYPSFDNWVVSDSFLPITSCPLALNTGSTNTGLKHTH
jgi:hypothetical protein